MGSAANLLGRHHCLVTARLTLPLLVEGPITAPSRQSCLDSQIGQNFMLCFCIFPQAGRAGHWSTGCNFFYYGKSRNGEKYPFANVTFFWPFDPETLWLGKFNQNCILQTVRSVSYVNKLQAHKAVLIEFALSKWQTVFTFTNGYLLPSQLFS